MKGYIFTLKDTDPVAVMGAGVHGTWQPPPNSSESWHTERWSSQMLSTLADYATIRPGDRIFFFSKRLIYGIGRVVDFGTGRGAFLNYPSADQPNPPEPRPADALIGPAHGDHWRRVRIIVPFVPDPVFFAEGIDMDEVLASPGAEAAWGLRFFYRVSFKQLGEDETRLLMRVFERRFGNDRASLLAHTTPKQATSVAIDPNLHRPFLMSRMVAEQPDLYVNGPLVRDEMTLHGLLVEALDPASGATGDLESPDRLDVFHELAASPPKPPVWADAMDVVGTTAYPGGGASGGWPSAVHYEILEAKRDEISGDATEYDRRIAQLMKYVDFVALNHAGGNYAAIDAAYVAAGFSDDIERRHADARADGSGVATRSYVLNPHEAEPTRRWSALRLLRYRWDASESRVRLDEVTTPTR